MEGSSASFSSCTMTYVDGTASVSCVDSTSSGYQVILLQDNDPYNLTVVNVRPGEKQTVPVVPSGRYCIMEVPMGDEFGLGVKYSREFTTKETVTVELVTELSTVDVIGIASKLVSVLSHSIQIKWRLIRASTSSMHVIYNFVVDVVIVFISGILIVVIIVVSVAIIMMKKASKVPKG